MTAILNRTRVLRLMNERGWNQTDLARAVGIPQSTVSRIMSGVMEPSERVVPKLLTATGLPYHELFDTDTIAAPRYLTATEVARRLGMSTRYVQRLALRGELNGIRLGMSARAPYRFTEVELARFIATQRTTRTL